MRWPELVPSWVCNTPITVYSEALTKYDGMKPAVKYDGMCNYSERSRQILDAQRQMIQLNATALIPGDICPGEDIGGQVYVNGGKTVRRIYNASRSRNPDGTVNYVRLDLI